MTTRAVELDFCQVVGRRDVMTSGSTTETCVRRNDRLAISRRRTLSSAPNDRQERPVSGVIHGHVVTQLPSARNWLGRPAERATFRAPAPIVELLSAVIEAFGG